MMKKTVYGYGDVKHAAEQKQEPLLSGSLDFTGTGALRTDMKFASLSAAHIHAHTLDIDEPATSCMTVRVANGIACSRSATAAITEL